MAWLFDMPPTTMTLSDMPSIDGGGCVVPDLAIDLVADDERPGVRRSLAASRRSIDAAERIRRRVDDDQLRLRRDLLQQRIDVDAPVGRLEVVRHRRRAGDPRQRRVREEAGIRHEHFIARIDVRLEDREERLLGAGRDADFVRIESAVAGDQLAQRERSRRSACSATSRSPPRRRPSRAASRPARRSARRCRG